MTLTFLLTLYLMGLLFPCRCIFLPHMVPLGCAKLWQHFETKQIGVIWFGNTIENIQWFTVTVVVENTVAYTNNTRTRTHSNLRSVCMLCIVIRVCGFKRVLTRITVNTRTLLCSKMRYLLRKFGGNRIQRFLTDSYISPPSSRSMVETQVERKWNMTKVVKLYKKIVHVFSFSHTYRSRLISLRLLLFVP